MRIFIHALVLAAVVGTTASGQQWKKVNGPQGLATKHLMISHQEPTTMYTLVDDIIYKTVDAGNSWTLLRQFDEFDGFFDLQLIPGNPEYLEVTSNNEVQRSTNGGESWETLFTTEQRVSSGTVHPSSRNIRFYTTGTETILVSRDDGTTWIESTPGFRPRYVALAPSDPGTAYAFSNSEFAVTKDTGRTWSVVEVSGVSSPPIPMIVDDADAELLIGYKGGKMYRSMDGGQNWVENGQGFLIAIDRFVRVPGKSGHFYAYDTGILYSSDHGVTYQVVQKDDLPFLDAMDVYGETLVCAGRNTSIYFSDDAGSTWQHRSAGINHMDVRRIFPVSGSTWYCASSNEISMTTDGGASWNFLSVAPSNITLFGRYYDVGVSLIDPDKIYVGDNQRMYSTADGGKSWIAAENMNSPYRAIHVDPNNADHVLAGGLYDLVETTNGGRDWTTIRNMVEGNDQADDLLISQASPVHWIVSSSHEEDEYAYGSIFITTNGGQTWESDFYPPNNENIFADPVEANWFYTSGWSEDVRKTTDGGMTWNEEPGPPWSWMIADRNDPETIYAVSAYGQLFQRSKEGEWTTLNEVDNAPLIKHFAVTPDGKFLAGTRDGLYWFDPTPVHVAETQDDSEYPQANMFDVLYDGTVRVNAHGAIHLRAFDVNGRMVYSHQGSGPVEIRLPLQGFFILQGQIGDRQHVEKAILR